MISIKQFQAVSLSLKSQDLTNIGRKSHYSNEKSRNFKEKSQNFKEKSQNFKKKSRNFNAKSQILMKIPNESHPEANSGLTGWKLKVKSENKFSASLVVNECIFRDVVGL